MIDDRNRPVPEPAGLPPSRRGFLKVAGAVAASAAAASVGCAPPAENDARQSAFGASIQRTVGFDRPLLNMLGDAVLPEALGSAGRLAAVTSFVAWVDGYDPVAEEMHGYGYADVRYLPADPAPGWRSQLDALDTLARKMGQKPFVELDVAARRDVVSAALASTRETVMPEPLGASHIAIALLAHWTASPAAKDLAMGAHVGVLTCRPLAGTTTRPLPIVGVAT
ncbi:MAG: twin-arginine translocation signal domain-containing protein [Gemmatimonadota bacterium]